MNQSILALSVSGLVIISFVWMLGRKRSGKSIFPGARVNISDTLSGVTSRLTQQMKFLSAVNIWLLLLFLFWVMEPEYFDWWFSRPRLFWGSNLGLLLIGLLWRTGASTLGKKWATVAVVVLLLLGFTKASEMETPFSYSWEEVKQLLSSPPPSTRSISQKSVDTGVPWQTVEHEGKDALVCVLKPGETSALLPVSSRPFNFFADSNLIVVVNGTENFIQEKMHLSREQCIAIGMSGQNLKKLRFKIPNMEKEEAVPVIIVFQ